MSLPIRIVLVDTSLARNIGSAARAMKTMGLDDLRLVRPQQFPHAEATALAAGAVDLLDRARVCGGIPEAVSDCGLVLGASARPRNAHWQVLDAREAAARAVDVAAGSPVAILFGNERNGLSNDDLALCHALVSIPANPAYESLNLAQAVQVVCYELRMAQGVQPRRLERDVPPATADEVARLHEHLARVLDAVGFTDARNAPHVLAKLQRLLGRAGPDQEEVQVLRGILTAIERSGSQGERR